MIITVEIEIHLKNTVSTILEVQVKNIEPMSYNNGNTNVTATTDNNNNMTTKKFLQLVAQTYNKERKEDPTLEELPSVDNLVLKGDDTFTFEEDDDIKDQLHYWSQENFRATVQDRRQEPPKKRIKRVGIGSGITVIAGGFNPTIDQFVVVRDKEGSETLRLQKSSDLLKTLRDAVFENDERLYDERYGGSCFSSKREEADDNSALKKFSIRIPLPDVIQHSYKIIEIASATDNTNVNSDKSCAAGMEALVSLSTFISKRMESVYSKWNEILNKGLVSFEALAKVFCVGSNVVKVSCGGFLQGGIVTSLKYKKPRKGLSDISSWAVTVRTINTDGKKIYEETENHTIYDFSPKLLSFSDLTIRPVTDSEKCMLTKRGQLFRELAIGSHHKAYLGMMSGMRADGRIMIDVKYGSSRRSHNSKDRDLDDSLLWITPPSLSAFSFRLRKFGLCHIELMSDIMWREDAWSKLVLPEAKKDLIHALVLQTRCQEEVDVLEKRRWDVTRLMNQTTSNDTHETKMVIDSRSLDAAKEIDDKLGSGMDFVLGKGGGCTMLFHGKPGTGKTLTAEAISELLRRPLYTVTVGELGTTAAELESKLKKILDLASSWKAIILLDEADVFLAQRNSSDINRNGLISIFLRTIEYYNGVLILTTNLPGHIDEAFLSRIHLSLYYEPLQVAQRTEIWRNFLEILPPSPSDEVESIMNDNDGSKQSRFDYERLAKRYEINGRQIRNVFHITQTLARQKKVEPTQEMIEEVINYCTQIAGDVNM